MPYEKGHPWHPPKDGIPPGRRRSVAQAAIALSDAIRRRLDADLLFEYACVILAGNSPRFKLDDQHTPIAVEIDPDGLVPTMAARQWAVAWLADRGFGTPIQTVQLEANVRARADVRSTAIDVGKLDPARLAALSALARAALASTRQPASVIDVGDAASASSALELEPASAPPASAEHAAESVGLSESEATSADQR